MARTKEQSGQFKFSSILAGVMLCLIVGYFFQSYTEIRKMKPVVAAVEHVSSRKVEQITEPVVPPAESTNE